MRSATTVGEWIDRIDPAPPMALHARLRDLLVASANRPASEVPEACLEAGEQLLDRLLASGSTSRDTALDLLAEGFRVYVAADAIGSRFAIDHEFALRRMAQAGVIVTTAEAAAFEWVGGSAAPEFKAFSKMLQAR